MQIFRFIWKRVAKQYMQIESQNQCRFELMIRTVNCTRLNNIIENK